MYARFTTKLASDWEVEDEGPLKDMLGVEVQRNKDGSITLHQRGYVRKVLRCPQGPKENSFPTQKGTHEANLMLASSNRSEASSVGGPSS